MSSANQKDLGPINQRQNFDGFECFGGGMRNQWCHLKHNLPIRPCSSILESQKWKMEVRFLFLIILCFLIFLIDLLSHFLKKVHTQIALIQCNCILSKHFRIKLFSLQALCYVVYCCFVHGQRSVSLSQKAKIGSGSRGRWAKWLRVSTFDFSPYFSMSYLVVQTFEFWFSLFLFTIWFLVIVVSAAITFDPQLAWQRSLLSCTLPA